MAEAAKQRRPGRGGHRRPVTGVVGSISGKQTINVTVTDLVKHPMYGKYMRRRTKLAVHDPRGQAGVGDTVQITPCRRVSKTKSWRLVRVVRPAAGAPAGTGREG